MTKICRITTVGLCCDHCAEGYCSCLQTTNIAFHVKSDTESRPKEKSPFSTITYVIKHTFTAYKRIEKRKRSVMNISRQERIGLPLSLSGYMRKKTVIVGFFLCLLLYEIGKPALIPTVNLTHSDDKPEDFRWRFCNHSALSCYCLRHTLKLAGQQHSM